MGKVIIRSKIGDSEIRYHVQMEKPVYEEYLKIKSENPEIDDREALRLANERHSKED